MKETVHNIIAPVDMTIALIADFHNADPTDILSSLQAHHPDMIAIAGDFLVGYRPGENLIVEEQTSVLQLIAGCARLAPTFVSLGNHEWMISDEDVEKIERTGAVALDNSFVSHTVNGRTVVLGALTSAVVTNYRQFRAGKDERYPYRERRPHGRKIEPEIGWLDEFEAVPGFRVLLCHHPEYYPRYLVNRKIDLILSGHAHGGQVRLFGRGVYAPGQGLLPKYTSGVYDGKLVVSRGLANTAGVLRLFNPTEIVYVRLSSEREWR